MIKIIIAIIGVMFSINAKSQSFTISPDIATEQCPGTDITFTITLPGTGYSLPTVSSKILATVQQQPISTSTSTGNTIFTFIGRFLDFNNTQAFTVNYVQSGTSGTHDFTFTKVKSLLTQNSYSTIQPSSYNITANRCQSQNFTISFSNVQYGNEDNLSAGFGSVTTYEYLLPTGWSLGSTTSTGSNWIAGNNSVTVTSDLTHGDGVNIQVRPTNSCSSGLQPGHATNILVSRPTPTLSITGGLDEICSGTSTYSVSGVPSGATIAWSISNSSVATIPSSSTGSSVTVTKVGTGSVTLTATVTDCIQSYTVSKTIAVGGPSAQTETNQTFTTGDYTTGLQDCNDLTNQITDGYYNGYVDRTDAVASTFTWTLISKSTNAAAQLIANPNNQHVEIRLKPQGSYAYYQFTESNSCGSYTSYYTFLANSDCPIVERVMPSSPEFSVTPNPAQDYIVVTNINKAAKNLSGINKNLILNGKKILIYNVNISDRFGVIKKSFVFKSGVSSANLQLAGLTAGFYEVSVFDGKNWNGYKLLIQK